MTDETEKPTARLWYTRRDNVTKGPFPIGLVRRFVLLGRLRPTDDVSPDGDQWSAVQQNPELIPDEMRDLDSEEGRQRYLRARMREDERARDRRSGEAVGGGRRTGERRGDESLEAINRRKVRARQREAYSRTEHYTGAMVILALIVAALVGLGVFLYRAMPLHRFAESECSASPRPGIVWSNCQLDGLTDAGADLSNARIDNADLRGADLHGSVLRGADLAYSNLSDSNLRNADFRRTRMLGAVLRGANLAGARLGGANLAFADLTGANLDGAHLDGANLSHAIWPDGRVCRAGSVGGCLAGPQ